MREKEKIRKKIFDSIEEAKREYVINKKKIKIYPVITGGLEELYSKEKDQYNGDYRGFLCKLIYNNIDDEDKEKLTLEELKSCQDKKLSKIANEFVKYDKELRKIIDKVDDNKNFFEKFIIAMDELIEKHYKKVQEILGLLGKTNKNIATPVWEVDSASSKKPVRDIINEELQKLDTKINIDYNIYEQSCDICNEKVDNLFYWYYLKNTNNINESKVICSKHCLEKFYGEYEDNLDDFEISEYMRCTAYYKCREIDNLRNMCEKNKSLNKSDLFNDYVSSNFCDPAQAGIVLSTYKINEILKKFSKESTKQFWITVAMTILVIILTAFNTYPIIKDIFVDYPDKEVIQMQNINSSVSQINMKLDNIVKDIERVLTSVQKQRDNTIDDIIEKSETQVKELRDLNRKLDTYLEGLENED